MTQNEKDLEKIKKFQGVETAEWEKPNHLGSDFGSGTFVDKRYGGKYFVFGRVNDKLDLDVYKDINGEDFVNQITVCD